MTCKKEAFIYKAGLITFFLLAICFLTNFTFVALAQEFIDYEIQKGDCLWSIAKQFQLSIQDIARTNNLDIKETLHPGLCLKIPNSEAENNLLKEPTSTVIHTVQKGESLWEIAQQYHLSLEQLSEVNKLKQPNSLHIGQEVKIPIADNNMFQGSASVATDGQEQLGFQIEKSVVLDISASLNLVVKESIIDIDYVV